MKFWKSLWAISAALLLGAASSFSAVYYIDADGGSDANAGTSPSEAWATLAEASSRSFLPGDQILLQAGDVFPGKLLLDGVTGSEGLPIIVDSYDVGPLPVIDAAGHLAGVHVRDAHHVIVRNLEITADGGVTVDGSDSTLRYGAYVDVTWGSSSDSITLQNLYIHDIFPESGVDAGGATPVTYKGTAIAVRGTGNDSIEYPVTNVLVEDCRIERTGFKAIELQRTSFTEVLNNDMTDIGGPAIQPSRCSDVVVRGNIVDGSGAFIDPRMHGRGSGIWPWSSERVLIEKNQFMHARGRADSCGMHIDFNCRDVVVQYNLSIDNAGGFIEILGNNHNCTYRYNISINDGSRVKGEVTQGTIANGQDGHVIWVSGYVGSGNTPDGPYNSYIYNNTIYVHPDITGKFSIAETSDGLLIANNIFHIAGPTADITADLYNDYTQGMIDRVVWNNNLYQRTGIIPASFPFSDTAPSIGDPLFANTGGLLPEDYIPLASNLVVDAGIIVDNIPGDAVGLAVGLAVAEDFFGNPVVGFPDMGAVELGGTPFPIPAAAFSNAPAYQEADSAVMTAVEGPYNTEYYFTEITGNYGGDDSGWQVEPDYVDEGLLPNTVYAYTVTLRNALDEEGIPSAGESVFIPGRQPVESQVLLAEDFSSQPDPDNTSVPYPVGSWFVAYEDESQAGSVATVSGKLRLGWGYDKVMVLWLSAASWNLDQDYLFTGDWEINTVLDFHLGIVVGVGEFDSVTGELLQRIKEVTVGELVSPVVGQSDSFSINVSSAELTGAGVDGTSRIGVFFEHDGDWSPLRNDVYLVDDLELKLLGAEPDADGDGVPDAVESMYGLNAGDPSDGAEDLDSDGMDNSSEFLAGTDLNNSNDVFRISMTQSGGFSEVLVSDANILPYRLYILEHAILLNGTASWTAADVFYGDLVEPGANEIFSLPNSDSQGFFRVRVEWK